MQSDVNNKILPNDLASRYIHLGMEKFIWLDLNWQLESDAMQSLHVNKNHFSNLESCENLFFFKTYICLCGWGLFITRSLGKM